MSRALSMLMAAGLLLGISASFTTLARASSGPPCPDLNDDGHVTIADIFIEGTYMGQTVPPAPPQTDMNKDGVVDSNDLAYFSPPLLPSPQWIAVCQTSPIGPSGGPVGGNAAPPIARVPTRDGQGAAVLALGALAVVMLAVARLRSTNR